MTLVEKMEGWARSDNPRQRQHAAHVLARLNGEPPPEPEREVRPLPGFRGTRRSIRQEAVATLSLYCRSCTGCNLATCHAGRGDAQGHVSLADCMMCLGIR